jgi:hypothetical protein
MQGPYADQFGFLIQGTDVPAPEVPGEHRIWNLADGIYFYEKW